MDLGAFLFIGLIILVLGGLIIGGGFLLYLVPKKNGHPKTAKYLTIIYVLFVLAVAFFIVFEDKLFTKYQAKELVEEQELMLTDQFEILENKSMSAIGDYYHTFTLKISEKNKQDAILKIKKCNGFKIFNTDNRSDIDSMIYSKINLDPYFGPKIIENYETDSEFVREYFQPSGRKGWAPAFRRISISKTKNELTFEDIQE
ncbi:MAG: hypothetical protein NTW49_07360 [Bacteroidia bacterium]|nr:hypothetical protein [Bacteroidia bacterium]